MEADSSFKTKFDIKLQHIKQTCSHGPKREGSESHILFSYLQKAPELPLQNPRCSTEHNVKLDVLDDYFIKYLPVLKFYKSSSIAYFYDEN